MSAELTSPRKGSPTADREPDSLKRRRSGSQAIKRLRAVFSREREGPTSPSAVASNRDSSSEKLLNECLFKLGKEHALEKRVAFVDEFCEFLEQFRFDRMFLEHVWSRVRDLCDPQAPPIARCAGFKIIQTLMKHHNERVGVIKADCWHIFQSQSQLTTEAVETFRLLISNGQAIPPFEFEASRILVSWLGHLRESPVDTKEALLVLTDDIIKFSFNLIPEPERATCITRICETSDGAQSLGTIALCLRCLDDTVRYSRLPPACLLPFVATLCRTVNIERFYEFSWTIMKHILNTAGHSVVQVLCSILDEPQNLSATNLLRGAVFFLCMAVWGSQRIRSLSVPPLQLLPSMNRVLDGQAPIIAHEVCLAIRRLVRKFGASLHLEWDLIISIFSKLRPYVAMVPSSVKFIQILSETLDSTSELMEREDFLGDTEELFSVLASFAGIINEASCKRLQVHQGQFIHPVYLNWLYNLQRFVYYFYQSSPLPSVRLATLQRIREVFDVYQTLYSKAILSTLDSIFHDTLGVEDDLVVYEATLDLLGHMLRRTPCKIADRVILLLQRQATSTHLEGSTHMVVAALVKSFHHKWPLSGFEQTLKIYHALLELLNHPEESARRASLQCILQLSCDSRSRPLLGGVRAPFLQLDMGGGHGALLPPLHSSHRQQAGPISMHHLVKVLVNRLLREKSAELFRMSLDGLRQMLANSFMLAGCSLQILADALLTELASNRFAGTVTGLSPAESLSLRLKAFQLVGLLLVGYRSHLSRDCPFDLVALLFQHGQSSEDLAIRTACSRLLAICCVDFPSGISYKSGQLCQLLLSQEGVSENVCRFMCAFLASSRRLARSMKEDDQTTLFSIVARLGKPSPGRENQANHAFRLLVLLFESVETQRRQALYRSITSILTQESRCLFIESNIDLLAKVVFSGTVLASAPPRGEDDDGQVGESSLIFSSADLTAHYLVGNALLSIQLGRMHWVRTVIRRASSCITWLSQIQNRFLVPGPERVYAPIDVWSSLSANISALPPEAVATPAPPLRKPIALARSLSLPANSIADDSIAEDQDEAELFLSYAVVPLISIQEEEIPERVEPASLGKEITGSWSFDTTFDRSEEPDDFPFGAAYSPSSDPPKRSQIVERTQRKHSDSFFLPHLSTAPIEVRVSDGSDGSEQIPLSSFYPPLPSYEEDHAISPSFHDGYFPLPLSSPELMNSNQLSEDAQMLLHSSTPSILSVSPRTSLLTPPFKPEWVVDIPSDQQTRSIEEVPSESSASGIRRSRSRSTISTIPVAHTKSTEEEESLPNQMAESIERVEPIFEMTESPGGFAIRKTRSITAPTVPVPAPLSPSSHRKLEVSAFEPESAAEHEALDTVHPSFIFLQMQQIPYVEEQAIPLKETEGTERSIQLLDMTKASDTFKFGICYVGEGQQQEEEILLNNSGSPRYEKFLQGMGRSVRLKNCSVYAGGLDRKSDSDGQWSIYYEDQTLQIMYHVVTMMRAKKSEGLRSVDLRKRHIGNNLVNIIFSEAANPFDVNTFSGQFNLVNIIVRPLDRGMYRLELASREVDEQDFALIPFPLVVQESSVPPLLREACLLAEIACRSLKKRSQVPNRQERLKLIQKLRQHAGGPTLDGAAEPRSFSAFPPRMDSESSLATSRWPTPYV